MSHNHQKKIAVINDFSGFGRCSLTVALPIISMLKVQCCPIPTSIFSNHTGFSSFYYTDFTDHMEKYIDEWKKLDLQFSGIYTGFLGSADQIKIVTDFFKYFKNSDTIAIIDPVMGDNGKLYPTYTDEMCQKMKELIKYADILTPNLTEACILTDTPYDPDMSMCDIARLAEKLSSNRAKKVVITGFLEGDDICNLCYEKDSGPEVIRSKKVATVRSGTGDVFASIIAADAVNNIPFTVSVQKAADFIKACIVRSSELDIPLTDGVCFEELLYTLTD